MSAKWIRSKAWDDRHLNGAWWPVKFALRLFSGIPLAVTLLTLVVVYGVLASVPIGLLALLPTYLIYAAMLVALVAVIAGVPVWLVNRAMKKGGAGGGARFVAAVPLAAGLGVAAWLFWLSSLWPAVRYDPVSHTGLRLFAEFVDAYKAVPMRRLPGMEMSELEFYAWWPLSLILAMFVVNMVVATVRRIEFRFENLGVLTVHTGIVLLALGSAYYSSAKREGDVLLPAGPPDAQGNPTPGPIRTSFYDNTRVTLDIRQDGRMSPQWESRLISGLPRYNDYALDLLGQPLGATRPIDDGPRRGLFIDVSEADRVTLGGPIEAMVDDDIRVRVVGYASYCDLRRMMLTASPGEPGAQPVRTVEFIGLPGAVREGLVERMTFAPRMPAGQVAPIGQGALMVQYTESMSDERWKQLATPLPEGARYGLITQSAGQAPTLHGITDTRPILIAATATTPAYEITIAQVSPRETMPIITPGYEGATSSVMIVRVTPKAQTPEQEQNAAGGGKPFTRYIYSRFPALNQDLSDSVNPDGRPTRTAADQRLALTFIDDSIVNVYFDERPGSGASPMVRGMVRLPGRAPMIVDRVDIEKGVALEDVKFVFKPGSFGAAGFMGEAPVPVPQRERQSNLTGNHRKAALAVEVSSTKGGPPMRAWVPFTEYFEGDPSQSRRLTLADGRSVRVAFARLRHPLPGMFMRLADFVMTPYPHSTQPKDFASTVEVIRGPGVAEAAEELRITGSRKSLERLEQAGRIRVDEARTSLNDPLLIGPYYWGAYDNIVLNAFGWVEDKIGPSRYKFSQSGWDPATWNSTSEAVARGELKRASVRYTILGVGNNPGYTVIFLGGILIFLGIPWAFYVKPWILRRRRDRLAAEHAAKKAGGTVAAAG